MRIDELTQNIDTALPYDIVDDIVVFMRNDPKFYRKYYYPAIADMAEKFRAKQEINDTSVIGSMVDKGVQTYCKKYNIGRKPADIFTPDDRQAAITLITSEELEEIRKGAY
jgi:hypothetical protein